MKNFKFLILLGLVVSLFGACDEEVTELAGPVTYERNDTVTALQVLTTTIPFTAGTPDYTYEFLASKGNSNATKISIFKTFTDSRTGSKSDTVILNSFDFGESSFYSATTSFSELREGLTLNGGALPDDELLIGIGSQWSLIYRLTDADGNIVAIGGETSNIAVLSPFAGDYTVIEGRYFRIGVESGLSGAPEYTGQTRFIGSVNDTTFSHPSYIGPLGPSTGFNDYEQFVFYLVGSKITIPADYQGENQQNYGTTFITCETDPGSLTNVDCINSNKLELSPDGKHRLFLTYGYFTDGSGPREFYEILEKIVD